MDLRRVTTTTNTSTQRSAAAVKKPTVAHHHHQHRQSSAALTNSCYTLLLVLLGFNLLVLHVANAQRVYYHSECGESPVVKYKELAKSIGWDFHQLIRFLKFEKPQDYEQILRSVKLYADCVALSQIPLK